MDGARLQLLRFVLSRHPARRVCFASRDFCNGFLLRKPQISRDIHSNMMFNVQQLAELYLTLCEAATVTMYSFSAEKISLWVKEPP